ncbi:hypothetical protein DV738_g845, partial [Chaetothyriales sp. CBS 135597]
MDSPLTQQLRPDVFEPKIVQLYIHLFNTLANNAEDEDDDAVPSEGFWREFFLLKPDKQRLFDILSPLTANELLHIQTQTQAFFGRSIAEATSPRSPQNQHALENLTAFLSAVFSKRYTNPSTDVIEVLAGLDSIDKLVSDLVNGLEVIIRQSSDLDFRRKAVVAALAMVAGAFQTSLVSYFMHRDLFPALMKYIHDAPDSGLQPFVLIGLLANYNKFEAQNVYQNRLEDFVNQDSINLLVHGLAHSCREIRDGYVAVQDDEVNAWSLSTTLNFVGLRALSPERNKPSPPTEEEAKALFNALPTEKSCVMLSAYSFVQANAIFASTLLSAPSSAFLSAISYLASHAYRNVRTLHYAVLGLLAVRLISEDSVLAKRLCSQDSKTVFRLCRQRTPHLPLVTSARIPTAAILDICTDTLSHNLRKRLDIHLHSLALGILLRVLGTLEHTKTRLNHHWPYLWASLLNLMRFLAQYSADMTYLRGVREELCTPLARLIAFCLSAGDTFLPDPASYDDLFYKLIEASDVLPKFKQAFAERAVQGADGFSKAMDALISVSSHYHSLFGDQTGRKKHQSPAAVQKVIRDGYESLNLPSDEDFGTWQKWRESSMKADLKKMIRTAVDDARLFALK